MVQGPLCAPATFNRPSGEKEPQLKGLEENIVVQLLSHVRLSATPWTATCQASLFFTVSRSLLKFMSIKSVMLSNQLLSHPLLLPPVFPNIKVFSNESENNIL